MKNNFKFKNRFRILKGGKVSLIVSAMLISSCLVNEAKAGGCSGIIDYSETSTQYLCENGLIIETTGSIEVDDQDAGIYMLLPESGEDYTINNKGKIIANAYENDSSQGIYFNLGEDSSLEVTI